MATNDPRERISQEAYDRRVQEAISVAQGDPLVKDVKYDYDNDLLLVEIKADEDAPGGVREPPDIDARCVRNCGRYEDPLFKDLSDSGKVKGFQKRNERDVQTGVHPEKDKPLYGTVTQHFRVYRVLFDGAGAGERVGQSNNVRCDPENNPNIK